MSPVIDMDDPLATPRDTPPSPGPPAGEQEKPPPKKRYRAREAGAAQLKLDIKEIETKLAVLLETPAVPMAAAGDVWPAQHIEARAGPLAKAIAHACRENVQLREKLLQLLRVGDGASLALAAGAYLMPILIYYGIIPAPPIVKAQFQIPDRRAAGVRQASMMEQMRAYEQQEREEREAPAEDVQSMNGQAYDPENPGGTPPPPGEAQTQTPPTI